MSPRPLLVSIACALAAPSVQAQSATDALEAYWATVCPGAVVGTELYYRCEEILNSGPGSAARKLAAAQGNNLELMATQGRMIMAMIRRRTRQAQWDAEGREGNGFMADQWTAEGSPEAETLAEGARWGWLASFGYGNTSRSTSRFERAYDEDQFSLMTGVDYRFSDRLTGLFALQYQRGDAEFANGSGSSDTDQRGVAAGLGWQLAPNLSLDLGLNAGRFDSTLTRQILYTLIRNAGTPLEDTVTIEAVSASDVEGDQRGFDLGLNGEQASGAWSFRYGINYSSQDTHIDRIAEDNPRGLDFLIRGQDIDSRQASLNLDVARTYSNELGVWQPYLRLGYTREFADDVRRIDALFRAGLAVVPVSFLTDSPDTSFGTASVGVVAALVGGWQGFASYEQAIGNEVMDSYRFDFGLRREF
jgi:hypothetical protein